MINEYLCIMYNSATSSNLHVWNGCKTHWRFWVWILHYISGSMRFKYQMKPLKWIFPHEFTHIRVTDIAELGVDISYFRFKCINEVSIKLISYSGKMVTSFSYLDFVYTIKSIKSLQIPNFKKDFKNESLVTTKVFFFSCM